MENRYGRQIDIVGIGQADDDEGEAVGVIRFHFDAHIFQPHYGAG